MSDLRKGPRGLPSIAQQRELRAQRGPSWTMRAGLIAGGAVIGGYILHSIVSGRELASGKEALLAKQRAVQVTLGAEWFPLRKRIEDDVLTAARGYGGDEVGADARSGAFRSEPGIYLRMRLADAKTPEAVARVAASAKRDAFAACLLRPSVDLAKTALDAGAIAEQPWNLGRAYSATRILGEEWSRAVRDIDDDMRLRLLSEEFDNAVRTDIPVAIDVVKRARFFLLVLDEDAPAAHASTDGGPETEEALQLAPHFAEVHLFDLKSGREMLRLRREGSASLISAGEGVVADDATRAAMQRQANNCALASEVQAELDPKALLSPH